MEPEAHPPMRLDFQIVPLEIHSHKLDKRVIVIEIYYVYYCDRNPIYFSRTISCVNLM